MRAIIIFALGLAVATVGTNADRIVGGTETTISQYPFGVVLLRSFSGAEPFNLACGGSIINNRAVLTAAHCFNLVSGVNNWRIRVGSTYHNNGGVVHTINRIIRHNAYNPSTADNDIAIMRINGAFSFNNNVRHANVAGYNPADNAPVWVIGWGTTRGNTSVRLLHVQVYVINQAICRARYDELRSRRVTDNMMCSGVLDVGGRDGCQGDSGGPVLHNKNVVAVTSWGHECAHPRYPGVNVRVSRYTSWIKSNQ